MSTKGPLNFGDFEVDEARCELRRLGAPVKIQSKPFALLVFLLKNRHRVVQREELLRTIWSDVTVSEQAFSSALRDLRRALGDTDAAHRIILTVRGHGFRFAAQVASKTSGAPSPSDHAPNGPDDSPAFALDTALVEREHAMAILLESLRAMQRGKTRVSFIRGPAGIGKTRLASEFARRATTLAVEVHVGRCVDAEGATPFWPWLQIVRAGVAAGVASGLAQQVGPSLPQLAWIAPELAASGQAEARADLEGAEARFRLFDATAIFLRRLSESRALVLVLDDLQLADEASLLLLEFVVQSLTDVRIHFVATVRDVPRPGRTLSRILEMAGRQGFADFVDLEGLHRESVSKVLGEAAQRPPAPEFVDSVLAATQGNPLFVAELAKLVARGQLDVTDARCAIPVPKRVRDAIRWQLERLSPDCRRLLELASASGREFGLAATQLALGESPEATLELLGKAEAAGLVVPLRSRPASFAFSHDLVRESIYQDIITSRRVRIHRQMAEALEALTHGQSGRFREIAYHYSEAVPDGVALKAVHYERLAGEHANSQMAFEDAVIHYDRALSALSTLPTTDTKARCELLLSQAEAAWGTLEDAEQVQGRFGEVASAAREAGDAELFARAALGRTGHGTGPGDFRHISAIDDVDIALLSEAETMLGKRPSELRALVLARLALAVRLARGLSVANKLSREAVEIAEAVDAPHTLAMTLRFRHEVVSGPAFAHERTVLAQRIQRLAQAVRSRPLELDALFFLSRACFERADLDGAAAAGKKADSLADTMRHPGAAFRSGIRKVLVLTSIGAFEKAESRAREFYDRDARRNMSAIGTLSLQLAMIRSLKGDHAGVVNALAEYSSEPWVAFTLALEQARAGDDAKARRQLGAAAESEFRNLPDDHCSLGCYLQLADICWHLGDLRSAAKLYGLMLPYEDLVAAPYIATVCQGSLARGLGTLAMLLGRARDAERHFVHAVAIEEKLSSPPLLALTLERYATLVVDGEQAGDRARASELIARASTLAEGLGMAWVVRRCHELRLRSKDGDESHGGVPFNQTP